MIKFSQFLQKINEEVTQTKRQGIIHFQQMKDEEFITWIRQIKINNKGILKDIKCVSKIDGVGARFGKDENGNIYYEKTRGVGPIFDVGAFSKYTKTKTDDVTIIARAELNDDLLAVLKTSSFMKVLPNNTKVVCEMFYNPMGKENDMGITFVLVQYDKKKLGSIMTIVPWTILKSDTGEEHPQKDEIIELLYKQSNSEIKFVNPNLVFKEIDINSFVDAASVIDDESLRILKSRKQADRIPKINIKNIIQKIKDDLAEYIINHPGIEGKFKLGPEIEGIVLWLNNKEYKITTNTFKDKMKQHNPKMR